jgi:hypothetical protein
LDGNIEMKRMVGSKPAGQLREWAC